MVDCFAGQPHRSDATANAPLRLSDDVLAFDRTWYVPANATLVIAGDFDRDAEPWLDPARVPRAELDGIVAALYGVSAEELTAI